MNDVAAAVGLTQLREIEGFTRARETIVRLYDRRLAKIPAIELPPRLSKGGGSRHAWHLYVLRRRGAAETDRNAILGALGRGRGIGAAIRYRPLCCEPYHRKQDRNGAQEFPSVHDVAPRTLTLPIASGVTRQEGEQVLETLAQVLRDRPLG